ncbi:hypothetical protein CGLO_18333 [Colletotrichum gloeosporioides Cg-14]|uniref:Uncharacterized protein n=1 Tax=Colletotrichum gloeosporioides (strain Cg-14) TaxID=1237896 RepID=T0JRU9_COLGC|nr:hypothetical protein CGLO_18333 [Colletotrichum gloeosporioides Cg-14]
MNTSGDLIYYQPMTYDLDYNLSILL